MGSSPCSTRPRRRAPRSSPRRERLEKHPSAAARVGSLDDLDGDPDVCLVLGGDGSILHALRRWSGTDVAVLGVNYGTIGFLAAVEREELAGGLERLFAREFDVMEMPGLELGMDVERPVALNDVSFTRRAHGRVAASPTASAARSWDTSAATASSRQHPPAPPATTWPTPARSWRGA